MSRRSKLIYLWSFNTILAAAVIALLTLLIASGGPAEHAVLCGDTGAGTTRDSYLPTGGTFASIEEAQTFICHEVAHPRTTPGWAVENISASRSGPAASVGRGDGFASVTLDYMRPNNPSADLRIEVSPYHIDPILYGIIDQVELMGTQANLIEGLDETHYVLQWEAGGFSFFVEARLTDSFGLPELYEVLDSIR